MIRIWADFNSISEDGRLWALSKKDLKHYGSQLREGIEVIVHMDDEFEVQATLTQGRVGWEAIPDMSTIR